MLIKKLSCARRVVQADCIRLILRNLKSNRERINKLSSTETPEGKSNLVSTDAQAPSPYSTTACSTLRELLA